MYIEILANKCRFFYNICSTRCVLNQSSLSRFRFSVFIWLLIGAVAERCSVKEVFLEISQNLQESNSARDSFW